MMTRNLTLAAVLISFGLAGCDSNLLSPTPTTPTPTPAPKTTPKPKQGEWMWKDRKNPLDADKNKRR